MVHSLKRLHVGQKVGIDAKVLPPDVPGQLSGLEQVHWIIDPLASITVQSHSGETRFRQLWRLFAICSHFWLVLDNYPMAQFVQAEPTEDRVLALSQLHCELEGTLDGDVRIWSGLSSRKCRVFWLVAGVLSAAAFSFDGPVG